MCGWQVAECCKGFYGPDCKPCIGGFQHPCYDKGTVSSKQRCCASSLFIYSSIVLIYLPHPVLWRYPWQRFVQLSVRLQGCRLPHLCGSIEAWRQLWRRWQLVLAHSLHILWRQALYLLPIELTHNGLKAHWFRQVLSHLAQLWAKMHTNRRHSVWPEWSNPSISVTAVFDPVIPKMVAGKRSIEIEQFCIWR